jgi:polyvinyl alcohol dehydrogenase (cytochrome)
MEYTQRSLDLVLTFAILALATSAFAAEITPDDHPGKVIYEQRCSTCHTGADKESGPRLASLRMMGRSQVGFALTQGKMREHVGGLEFGQVDELISYVAVDRDVPWTADGYMCEDKSISAGGASTLVGAWGFDQRNTRFQPNSTIDSTNIGRLELTWVFGLPDVAEVRSQPVITTNAVFVSSVSGYLFALDRDKGCVKWHDRPADVIRTSLSLGEVRGRPALFFGGVAGGQQTVFAINAQTGGELWRKDVALFNPGSILTGGIVQHFNKVIVPISAMGVGFAMNPNFECCKSHGGVRALDADTGEILWTVHMTPDAKPTYKNSLGVQQWGPSGAPVWTTPAIDAKRNLIYVGTGENTSTPATDTSDAIVAIDINTGSIKWLYQGTKNDAFNAACLVNGPNCPKENGPDFDFGASAILAKTSTGDDIVLAGQKSGIVHALNPDDGELLWRTEVSHGSALGGVHWGMAINGSTVVVPINDPGSFALPGGPPKPGVYGLDIDTGTLQWSYHATQDCEPSANPDTPWPDCPVRYTFSAAASSAGDLAFAGSLAGIAYAFNAATGEVVWEYDTSEAFEAVNGLSAHGGGIDNPGVQVAGDMLFVESGYSMFGAMPGNVLLAFKLR